jgi:hypothetical protein
MLGGLIGLVGSTALFVAIEIGFLILVGSLNLDATVKATAGQA